MNISIVSGKGEGQTLLSAFDAALMDCGVHNFNLICLSSIIPPGSRIVQTDRFEAQAEQYGHKAYVVKADMRSKDTGTAIGAGLGWYQFDDGRGIFVEHEVQADSKDHAEESLKLAITQSVQSLCASRNIPFHQEKMRSAVSITKIQDKPACVLTLAVYQTEGWTTQPPFPHLSNENN